ncbi:flagellin N-terminal helical domain-containing protein [Paenibacillus baimaensis]|uniref:flagellin N-terminal helical domain-containing protein n=1 Tax=Paenibacillus baimaensis TaxID=2982185 RepID=UPI00293EF92E|nr:flagellin [Paenibacillus sp. WQ 127069]
MRINHNIAALNTHRQLTNNSGATNKALEKLSSGLRINKAADDAAGLAISEKMRGQIRGLTTASTNAQDSISLIQTAEGALNETHSILQRMRELAVQASNDTATDSDRGELQKEVSQLKSEVDRIASTTEFNTKKLLNGSLTAAKTVQGSIDVSNSFKAGDIAATGGTAGAGLVTDISSAAAGKNGTGYSLTGQAALAEKTVIETGVNDQFIIEINGTPAAAEVKIAASSGDGYTRSQFVDAVNEAIRTAVGAANNGNQFNQAVASLTADNHLQITTVSTGSSSAIKLDVKASATAGQSATQSMGFAGKASNITGTVDLKNGFTTSAAGTGIDLDFSIQIGKGAATAISFGYTKGTSYTFDKIKTDLQDKLDTAYGKDIVKVGDDGSGHLSLTSKIATDTFKVTATGANLFGSATPASTADTLAAAAITKGTNTTIAIAGGTVISNGANDQLKLTVDGGTAQTITLKAGNYSTPKDLVNEINNQINSNSNLVGKARAELDNNGKIQFVSNTTGASSSITVDTSSSASATIGFAGAAGVINGSDIAAGVDFTAAAKNTKFDVTLGNKTVTIDLLGQDGINTNGAAASKLSSRDAVVKALQNQLDKSFGVGAITVNTVTSGATDKLSFTTNARTSTFKIEDGAAGGGATVLTGAATNSGSVSSSGVNTNAYGTDLVKGSLSTGTSLSTLADVDGNGLGIKAGNVINISGTQNGKGFSTSVTVKGDSSVADILNSMRNLDAFKGATVSLDTTSGKIQVTGADGASKDISNLSFSAQKSATDTTGVASFNTIFGKFTETQQAQNAKSDNSLTMQIGANAGQSLKVDINDMGTEALRIQDVDVSTAAGAQTAISVVDNAIVNLSSERAKLGAYQNRLEHTINNLGTSAENLTSSESRIRDVDMAKEMMEFTKNNILSQAAQSMLAQANQQPQGVLQLLR